MHILFLRGRIFPYRCIEASQDFYLLSTYFFPSTYLSAASPIASPPVEFMIVCPCSQLSLLQFSFFGDWDLCALISAVEESHPLLLVHSVFQRDTRCLHLYSMRQVHSGTGSYSNANLQEIPQGADGFVEIPGAN